MKAGLRARLLATIPFVLLLNSDRVTVTTEFFGDVSGRRTVQAEGDTSLKRQIGEWTRDFTPGFDSDGTRIAGARVTVDRSLLLHDLSKLPDVQASAVDIVQEPFSLRTRYNWSERLTVGFTYDDDKEHAAAPYASLEYRVAMPGRIVNAPGAEINGNTATWTLKGDQPTHDVSATAVSWRWDLIILLVYVLGYLTYRGVGALAHRARLRPRKI